MEKSLQSPDSRSVCAVIVTYHPDPELGDRVALVTKQVSQVVIVDNGSSASCIEQIRNVAEKSAIHLISNTSNEGLASALNAGTRWAASQGYRWVLTLDQDTTVAPDMICSLAKVFQWYPFPERLALIGSNYRHKENGRVWWNDTEDNGSCPGREMMSVLTSGSLVSVDVFQAIGGFRSDFFIDCVDHEYCLRARAHGFRSAMTFKPVMEHGIGYLTEHRLLWKTVGTSNHSPARQYFMVRNTLILSRDYISKEPGWVLWYLRAWAKSIVVVFLFEEERIAKLKSMIRGCVDGILGRTTNKGEMKEIGAEGRRASHSGVGQ
jgi:rhamnosyltransferase